MNSEKLIFQIIDESPFPQILIVPDYPKFTIKYANQKILSQLNLKRKDLIGERAMVYAHFFFDEAHASLIIPELKQVVDEKKGSVLSFKVNSKGVVKNQPIFNDKGEIEYILGTVTEVDFSADAKYKLFFEEASDAIFISNTTGKITEVNEMACSMFGYTQTELLQLYAKDLIEKNELKQRPLRLDDLPKEKYIHHQRTAVRKDGSKFYIDVGATSLHNGSVLTTVRDISERTAHAKALKESERRLMAMFNNEPNCVKVVNQDLLLLDMNLAGLKQIEADNLDEVLGQSVLSLVAPEYQDEYKDTYLKALNGTAGNVIFKLNGLKGTTKWLESQAVPFQHFKGNKKCILCITRDITAEKEASDMLRISNERLELVTNATNDAVWEWNRVTNEFWGNPGLYNIYGYKNGIGDISSKEFFTRVHPHDTETIHKRLQHALKNGMPQFTGEYKFKVASGEYRHFFERVLISYNAEGSAIRIIGAMQDITEQKQSKEALVKSDQKYRYLFINNPLPMCIYDFNSLQILDCNEAACTKYGYTKAEALQLTIRDLSPSSEVIKLEKVTSFPVEQGDKHKGVFIQRTKNSEVLYMEITTHIIDYMGKTAGLALANDITEKVKANLELQTSNQRLKLSNRIGKLAYFELNLGDTHLRWSSELYRLVKIGRGKKQLNLERCFDAIHQDDRELVRTLIAHVAEKKTEHRLTYRIIWPDQQIRHINTVVKVSKIRQGKVVALEGTMQDVTERQEYTEALERQNDTFRKIAWTQSHVVRAPLVRIMGVSNLILDGGVTHRQQKELLENLVSSSEELDKVIRDIVNLAQEIKIN